MGSVVLLSYVKLKLWKYYNFWYLSSGVMVSIYEVLSIQLLISPDLAIQSLGKGSFRKCFTLAKKLGHREHVSYARPAPQNGHQTSSWPTKLLLQDNKLVNIEYMSPPLV